MGATAVIPRKIVWLASYPKSGNTWFRAFISAILNDGAVDINNLLTDGLFASRAIFEACSDFESRDLYDDEAKRLQPVIFNYHASTTKKERLFIKVHDAYGLNMDEKPIIPTEPTICALYFIRNPLDIAGSLASHLGCSLDASIALINNQEDGWVAQQNNQNIKRSFPQFVGNWTDHVKSWDGMLPFPVKVIRYEDMLSDTFNQLKCALQFIGMNIGDEEINRAIAASRFDKLQKMETGNDFVERKGKASFFRKGQAGNWLNELTEAQVSTITTAQLDVMDKYNYKGK